MAHRLIGKKFLVVEDNPIIAYDLRDFMEDVGAETVGPALDLDSALQLARHAQFDAAVLDINLGEKAVWPLAEELERKDVPFVFISSVCAEANLPDAFRHRRCLDKPARREEIVEALAALAL